MNRKYTPEKTQELLQQAIALRATGLMWKEVIRRLDITKAWLRFNLDKIEFDRKAQGAVTAVRVCTPHNIAEARRLRAEGVRWKTIGRQLGVRWESLSRAITQENRAKGNTDALE